MPRVLIIGCGNPLRGDDGLAWRVAEKLGSMGLPGDVEIITQHQLTPELASHVSQAARVLFIDASATAAAGEISWEEIRPVRSVVAPFSHQLSPAAVLNLSQELYGHSPQAFLISIGAENFEHGESLSPKVEAALTPLLTLLTDLIKPGLSSPVSAS